MSSPARLVALAMSCGASLTTVMGSPTSIVFAAHEDPIPEGVVFVETDQRWEPAFGHGFEVRVGDSTWAPDSAVFAAAVPEGVHAMTLTLRWHDPAVPATVRVENRQLLGSGLLPEPGSTTRTFIWAVQRRSPALADGRVVRLPDDEAAAWLWDDRLQVEVAGSGVELESLSIVPAPSARTVFILGDSTVADQDKDPWIGWGQMLPSLFDGTVAFSNHAKSGASLRSFRDELRTAKVIESIRPGDVALVQFGHNDQKHRGEGDGPWTTYRDDLREIVALLRARGARPVLVTSVKRRRFDAEGRQVASLGDFPRVVRAVAEELDVPLVDLNRSSGVLFAALGPEGSKRAFVHYPADTFPGQTEALKDDSHFNATGGHLLARCVAEDLRPAAPDLARHLRPDLPRFDPAAPGHEAAFTLPPAPMPGKDPASILP